MVLKNLLSPTVQQFIRTHEHDDELRIVLAGKTLDQVPAAALASQIAGRRKAKTKLPFLYNTPNIVYPPAVAIEQSSSEVTAKYKGTLISSLKEISDASGMLEGVDLSGGFGVDTYFISRLFRKFHYVEPDAALLEIVSNNYRQLGISNVEFHPSTAEQFLRRLDHRVAFIYVDPSRRNSGTRVVRLSDAAPNVTVLEKSILTKTDLLLVKASPLLDISQALSELETVAGVFVIALGNEVKELLFLCRSNFVGEVSISAINLLNDGSEESFAFNFSEEQSTDATYADPAVYIYEPNAAILKAGAFKTVAKRFGLGKLNASTHLYTHHDLLPTFPGRVFRIEKLIKPERAALRPLVPDGKVNVITRNYPLSALKLKEKLGVIDGGDRYLLAFSGVRSKFVAFASRVK